MMILADCASNEVADLATLLRKGGAVEVEAFSATDGPYGLLIFKGEVQANHRLAASAASQLFGGGKTGAAGGPYLFRVGIWVPSAHRTEFLDWYKSEHLPILLECPTWGGCRFVEAQTDDGHQFFALHQIDNPAALESEERKRSRATPWFKRLKQHSWFDEAFKRQLYIRKEA